MTATDELRRLLDERGVEWGANDTYRLLVTSWNEASGHSWAFMEHRDGSFSKLTAYHLTPKQAIAATLGRGECRRVLYEPTGVLVCSECGAGMPKQLDKYCFLHYCPNCGRKVRA